MIKIPDHAIISRQNHNSRTGANHGQGFSRRRRPRRPHHPRSLKPSIPSFKSTQISWFLSMAFVVCEKTSEIQSRTLRTVTWNLKIQDGKDVDVSRDQTN